MIRMLALGCMSLAIAAPAMAGPKSKADVRVMTQNQYLGTDLTPIVAAPDAASFNQALVAGLAEIAASNTPERVAALADQIRARDPHLVALQEMFEFTCMDLAPVPEGYGCTDPLIAGAFNDHLALTMDALGDDYYVAGTVENLNLGEIQIPGLPGGIPFYINGVPALLGAMDRDVTLARSDIYAQATPIPCARPSMDGCNFQAVASANSPVGPIAQERGFVIVDAFIEGAPYRFINTHLEVANPDPSNKLSMAVQSFQAYELIQTAAAVPSYPGTELIIAGDFNSNPEEAVVAGVCALDNTQACYTDSECTAFCVPSPYGPVVPPYMQFQAAGYADAWDYRPGNPDGFTCCQDADLLNEDDASYERIDLIWTASAPSSVKANTMGYDESDRISTGQYPSDHATVYTEITF